MYKRVVLKLSGDSFQGNRDGGIDFNAVATIVKEITVLHNHGVQMTIVNGAGNIFRGRSRPSDFDAVAAHKIGCLATLPNSLALTESLNASGIDTRLMSAFEIPGIARQFDSFRARKLLNQGVCIIATGGTGHPFFSNDTAAVLRGLEIKAEIVLKATAIDGVYNDDPQKNPSATRYETLTFKEALRQTLGIMDQTAFVLAAENNLPIFVFKFEEGSMNRILKNNQTGTLLS